MSFTMIVYIRTITDKRNNRFSIKLMTTIDSKRKLVNGVTLSASTKLIDSNESMFYFTAACQRVGNFSPVAPYNSDGSY